jgi:hypothetical protein
MKKIIWRTAHRWIDKFPGSTRSASHTRSLPRQNLVPASTAAAVSTEAITGSEDRRPTSSAVAGAFRIGAHRTSATAIGGYFKGEVAEVLTYNQVVIHDDGNDAIWDFDGDRKPDLIAADAAGRLYLYRGNGAGGFKYGFGANIGNGWDMYNTLFTPGDFNGDGYADVAARKPDGKLYLHPGNGAGGWLTNSGTEIGSGWDAFNTVFSPGDFNGDGHPDVIARNTNGDLYLARGNGAGGWVSGTSTKIGTGWQTFTAIF